MLAVGQCVLSLQAQHALGVVLGGCRTQKMSWENGRLRNVQGDVVCPAEPGAQFRYEFRQWSLHELLAQFSKEVARLLSAQTPVLLAHLAYIV